MITFTFAVYDLSEAPSFEAFLLDVPALTEADHDRAARRAYFTAMSYLRDVAEPEVFQVCAWIDNKPGEAVGPGGFSVKV